MKQSITLDGNKLKAIAHRTPTATVTANSLAGRERIRHFSDITRTRSQLIREGQMIVDADYEQFWNDLQAAGVGSIVYGRKGKPNRFAWHYSLKSVAKSMLQGVDMKVNRQATVAEPQEVEAPEETQPDNVEQLTQKVTFVLSANRVMELRLPDNFSKTEADAVCTALRTLADKA